MTTSTPQGAPTPAGTTTDTRGAKMNPPTCSEDLLEAMRAGLVSLADTACAAQESPDAQHRALEAVRCGRAPTLTAALTPDEPASGEQLTIELNAEETADLDAIVAHYQARQPGQLSREHAARVAIREFAQRLAEPDPINAPATA